MELPEDLKNYRADQFQLLPPDAAVLLICALSVAALIFWPYLT